MSNLYPPAALCELCKQIFEGCWVSKESLQLRGQNNPTGLTEEPISSALRETESWPGDDTNSSDDGFYEEPDWVKLVAANESDCASLVPQNYYSPTHHNIEMLERSAKSGCYLCTIFWDLVHDMVHELEGPKKEEIDRLMGVVIARPNQEESFEEDIIQLELSYFVDAKLKQDAFAFTVGIILWRFTRMFFPRLSSPRTEPADSWPNRGARLVSTSVASGLRSGSPFKEHGTSQSLDIYMRQ
jgi:hypothetical protein